MTPQFASAVPRRDLSAPVTSLADHTVDLIDALDVLIGGV